MSNITGTRNINKLPRTTNLSKALLSKKEILLLPDDVKIIMTDDYKIETIGLGLTLDSKKRDLLRIIKINDALKMDFELTNVISPRTYVESLSPIPQHISIQCILLSKVREEDIKTIYDLIENTKYGKTIYDEIWISKKTSYKDIKPNSILYIMNRRVGGWAGSKEKPVIELLGAGGHIGIDDKLKMFDPIQTVINELNEELGLQVSQPEIKLFGGFHNKTSNELVLLCGAFIPSNQISNIQQYALGNYEQDTDGIYLGILQDVISQYLQDSSPFAGGEKAKKSNFPMQKELMNKVYEYISK